MSWERGLPESADHAITGTIPTGLGTIPMALGYMAVIILWSRSGSRHLGAFRNTGRMALTNYLTQTVLGLITLGWLLDGVGLTRTMMASGSSASGRCSSGGQRGGSNASATARSNGHGDAPPTGPGNPRGGPPPPSEAPAIPLADAWHFAGQEGVRPTGGPDPPSSQGRRLGLAVSVPTRAKQGSTRARRGIGVRCVLASG